MSDTETISTPDVAAPPATDAPASGGPDIDQSSVEAIESHNDSVYDSADFESIAADESEQTGADPVRVDTDDEDDDNSAFADAEDDVGEVEDADDDSPKMSRFHLEALEVLGLTPEDVANFSVDRLDALTERALELRGGRADNPDDEDSDYGDPEIDYSDSINSTMDKLVEEYGEEIRPMGEVLGRMEAANANARQIAAEAGSLANDMSTFITDMAMDMLMSTMTDKYPSLSKADARNKVAERFWTEWSTGEYGDGGGVTLSSMRSALENSAKVVFSNTDETTAAANLVKKNQQRVASQPGRGSAKPSRVPSNPQEAEDMVYDDALSELLQDE